MSDEAIAKILDFWFAPKESDTAAIDSRMELWFGTDQEVDQELDERFGSLLKQAAAGELDDWAATPEGRLALIILLDQWTRNIHRGSSAAFEHDRKALSLCVEGVNRGDHKHLDPFQQAFMFMPLQHAESVKVQEKSVEVFQALAQSVPDTLRETFDNMAHYAELHRDIVKQFGRFPHRNKLLGRDNTSEEDAYLSGDTPVFGQA